MKGGQERSCAVIAARRSRSARVAKFGLPTGGALRNEIKEVPDTTEIVTRFEGGIRHPNDLVALALEDRNARHRAAIRAISHIFRKRRSLVGDHGKLPAATGGETLLPLECVRRRHYKSRAIAQVLE